MEKFLKKYTLR